MNVNCFTEENILKTKNSVIIILCVKPKDIKDVCLKINSINKKLIIFIAAKELALDNNTATKIATQILIGAGSLTSEHLDDLIDKVISKGGTTETGLQNLESGGINKLVKTMINAAYKLHHRIKLFII